MDVLTLEEIEEAIDALAKRVIAEIEQVRAVIREINETEHDCAGTNHDDCAYETS